MLNNTGLLTVVSKRFLKDGLSLKIRHLDINLYFIATYEIMPLWNI